MNKLIILLAILLLCGCQSNRTEINGVFSDHVEKEAAAKEKDAEEDQSNIANQENINDSFEKVILVNEAGTTLETRFLLPDGYKRIDIEASSFGTYLRNLSLKAHGSKVTYFDGRIKDSDYGYEAVVDMDIGDRDLQQCADAIMRLRGEYLYHNDRQGDIHFNLTNGFRMDYEKWTQGYRVRVRGNSTSWVRRSEFSDTYDDFRNYMTFVFTYAGTLSLSQELTSIPMTDMTIGDVLIRGGSPGHGVIVVDMAVKEETGEKLYMLAQSYMPAQDIQILANPTNENLSPWYQLTDDAIIMTPEWIFTKEELKRFE